MLTFEQVDELLAEVSLPPGWRWLMRDNGFRVRLWECRDIEEARRMIKESARLIEGMAREREEELEAKKHIPLDEIRRIAEGLPSRRGR